MTRGEILKNAKPILFNTEMVRMILKGRKTETRLLIKPQPPDEMPDNHNICRMPFIANDGKIRNLWYMDVIEQYPFKRTRYFEKIAPYSKGDYLYVRETFARLTGYNGSRFVYKASDKFPFGEKYIAKFRWHPSIHMSKEAARIFLHVTDVRIERLKEIENGWKFDKEGIVLEHGFISEAWRDFQRLWDSTIKPKDRDKYGWDANPWVWVIKFERMEVEM